MMLQTHTLTHIPVESIKSLHFGNGPLFSCGTENNIEFDIYNIGRITSPASFDTTFVGEIFMVDCPSLKLGNSVKTHLCQI